MVVQTKFSAIEMTQHAVWVDLGTGGGESGGVEGRMICGNLLGRGTSI